MPPFRDTLARDSDFWEACARHSNRQTCRLVQTIYYCDDCAQRLTVEAFNGRPPIYHGETVEGFCGLCNERKRVTLRQWFVCAICWNVILAYQKAFVASNAVHVYWRKSVTPVFPKLILTEKEAVYLSPLTRKATTKRQAAEVILILDFAVEERTGVKATSLFHIELKSGPGAIEEMREFQLDINDSNDIIGAVINTKLPAYIFHVQLEHEYAPPTRSTLARGIWWTDIFTFFEKRIAIRARRGEDKQAGYYSPSVFKPIATFLDELKNKRYIELKKRLKKNTLAFS
jgi:hypothetical protein